MLVWRVLYDLCVRGTPSDAVMVTTFTRRADYLPIIDADGTYGFNVPNTQLGPIGLGGSPQGLATQFDPLELIGPSLEAVQATAPLSAEPGANAGDENDPNSISSSR